MGVKALDRTAPWWLTAVMVGGLVFLYVGERILVGAGVVRVSFSVVGGVVLLGALAWRFVSWRNSSGEGKRVERALLLSYVGCLVAVLGSWCRARAG